MKVTIPAVYTVMDVVLYNVEIDIPDDVLSSGERAVTEWLINNPSTVDMANSRSETLTVLKVTGHAGEVNAW